jgi:hypothetical protein
MRLGNRILALLFSSASGCDKATGHVARVNGRPSVADQQRGVMLDAERCKSIVSDRMQRNTVVGPVGWYTYVFCFLFVQGDT